MSLTDVQIRNAKAEGKPRKLADSRGLYLWVTPTGGKSWRLDYRFANNRRTVTFGLYPAVSLAEARSKRDEAKRLLAANIDPSLAKQRAQLEAKAEAGNTFGVIADDFLAKLRRDGRAEATIVKNTWMLKTLAAPLAKHPITQISAKNVLAVLTALEKRGAVESALATRSAIGRVFRYAISTDRAESDPTSALRGALQRHTPSSHSAITDQHELGGLMRAIFLQHLAPVRRKRWVVYAKAPFAGPEAVLAYLSRYTHRVAISNSRLPRAPPNARPSTRETINDPA